MTKTVNNGRHAGTVKWFSPRKGYGFIIPDGSSEEIFAHYSDIEGDGYRNLHDGERVTFSLACNGDKGTKAVGILPFEVD